MVTLSLRLCLEGFGLVEEAGISAGRGLYVHEVRNIMVSL